MSEPQFTVKYVDDPWPVWRTDEERPFRCDRCHKMRPGDSGKYVHRWPGVAGHFVAVCADGTGCARPWWKRLLGIGS